MIPRILQMRKAKHKETELLVQVTVVEQVVNAGSLAG